MPSEVKLEDVCLEPGGLKLKLAAVATPVDPATDLIAFVASSPWQEHMVKFAEMLRATQKNPPTGKNIKKFIDAVKVFCAAYQVEIVAAINDDWKYVGRQRFIEVNDQLDIIGDRSSRFINNCKLHVLTRQEFEEFEDSNRTIADAMVFVPKFKDEPKP